MKCLVQVPALGHSEQLGDPHYEERCIRFDAERAAKMGEPIEKACSWEKGTWQYAKWMQAYRLTLAVGDLANQIEEAIYQSGVTVAKGAA